MQIEIENPDPDGPGTETHWSDRTILHVVWTGTTSDGSEVRYSPIVFVDGLYIGWNRSFPFTDAFFGPVDEPTTVPEVFQQALVLRKAPTDGSVLLAFVDQDRGRLGSLHVKVLPLEWSLLGLEVEQTILDLYGNPGGIQALGDEVTARIIIIGSRTGLGRTNRQIVNSRVRAYLQEQAMVVGVTAESLAQGARSEVLSLAGELGALPGINADASQHILEVQLDEENEPIEFLAVTVQKEMPIPEIGEQAPRLYLSPDGRDLLVSWWDPEADELVFVRTELSPDGTEWTDPTSIALSEELTFVDALELLEKRLD